MKEYMFRMPQSNLQRNCCKSVFCFTVNLIYNVRNLLFGEPNLIYILYSDCSLLHIYRSNVYCRIHYFSIVEPINCQFNNYLPQKKD